MREFMQLGLSYIKRINEYKPILRFFPSFSDNQSGFRLVKR